MLESHRVLGTECERRVLILSFRRLLPSLKLINYLHRFCYWPFHDGGSDVVRFVMVIQCLFSILLVDNGAASWQNQQTEPGHLSSLIRWALEFGSNQSTTALHLDRRNVKTIFVTFRVRTTMKVYSGNWTFRPKSFQIRQNSILTVIHILPGREMDKLYVLPIQNVWLSRFSGKWQYFVKPMLVKACYSTLWKLIWDLWSLLIF